MKNVDIILTTLSSSLNQVMDNYFIKGNKTTNFVNEKFSGCFSNFTGGFQIKLKIAVSNL